MKLLLKLPFKLPNALYESGEALLCRSFLKISGSDSFKFLNGLTTNQLVDLNQDTTVQYSAFLSPQGRVMYDMFIWRLGNDEYLIDADRRIGNDLYYHIRQFKIRSKVNIENASNEFHVRVQWNNARQNDPRGGIGLFRSLISGSSASINCHPYDVMRYAMGIPEGPLEIPTNQAIPLEYNLDWLGAISYNKGCYVGQELVARTHHRGTIRKRIMPIMLSKEEGSFDGYADVDLAMDGQEIIPIGTDMKPVGKIISTKGNLALGLVRLDSIHQRLFLPTHKLYAKPFIPPWWPAQDK